MINPDRAMDAKPIDKPETPSRKSLGPAFWAGILFGLVCVFLGAVVGIWGSRIMPPPLEGPPAVVGDTPQPAQAPVAGTGPPPAPVLPAPAAQAGPADAPPALDEAGNVIAAIPFDPASDTYALEQRLAQLQAANRDTTAAARAALAAAALTQAAEGSAPFANQVDSYRAVLPNPTETQALRDLAAAGAPTRAMLAERFPTVAARAAAAARQGEPRPGLAARIARMLTGLVSVRRTDQLTGPGADAVIARAERAVERGDLTVAVRELATLPPAARAAAGPWRTDAERRLAMERSLGHIRAATLARLNAEGAGG
jgi:hypothetical protein